MKNWLNNIKPKKKSRQQKPKGDYFEQARDWATDRYQLQTVASNRWQLAFWLQLAFSLILALCLLMVFPLKSWEPLIIERDLQTGEIFTRPITPDNLPTSQAEIQSDLVRYVISRETYAPADEGVRYRQVQFMSSPDVFTPYEASHRIGNEEGFEKTLGRDGSRIVKVEDVIFIDASDPRRYEAKRKSRQAERVPPIAKVDFVTIETKSLSTVKQHWVATISFDYVGTPNTKEAAWANWSGFTVTSYRVDQRNV